MRWRRSRLLRRVGGVRGVRWIRVWYRHVVGIRAYSRRVLSGCLMVGMQWLGLAPFSPNYPCVLFRLTIGAGSLCWFFLEGVSDGIRKRNKARNLMAILLVGLRTEGKDKGGSPHAGGSYSLLDSERE